MPGSPTTPGRQGARISAPFHFAFRHLNSVSTRDSNSIVAPLLAYMVGIEMRRVRNRRVRWQLHQFPDGPQSGSQ
jgi:hypothetical protein